MASIYSIERFELSTQQLAASFLISRIPAFANVESKRDEINNDEMDSVLF